MHTGIHEGFFYRGIYFLLPQGYADTNAFRQALETAASPLTVTAQLLPEKSPVAHHEGYEHGVCLAPYFIADYLPEPEELVIEDATDVYPAQVELLTQKAYNDRLRALVEAYCPGCRGYGGLSANDSSLSGHFDEMTLNGVCLCRWETRTEPRSFYREMLYMANAWARYNYSADSEAYMRDNLKFDLKLAYTAGELVEDSTGRTLTLAAKKTDFFFTVLTDHLARFVKDHVDESYTLRLKDPLPFDEASILALVTPKKIAATRKEFKKYGVALAVLTCDPDWDGKVRAYLENLESDGLLRLLVTQPGQYTCLLAGPTAVLMDLRAAAPFMQRCHASITVYNAQQTVRYQITYAMPSTCLDIAGEDKVEQKLIKRIRLAEKGKLLSYDQVQSLMAYVQLRLLEADCDHTLRHTSQWLKDFIPPEQHDAIIKELWNMGGFCDCEVLMNGYQEYDLED